MVKRKKRNFTLPEGMRPSGRMRPLRVAEAIRNELLLFFQREVRDPRLAGVRITGVRISPDLKQARVFYTSDPGERGGVVRGLERARGFVRSHLARVLNLRYTPAVSFTLDSRADENLRLEKLFHEIGSDNEHGS